MSTKCSVQPNGPPCTFTRNGFKCVNHVLCIAGPLSNLELDCRASRRGGEQGRSASSRRLRGNDALADGVAVFEPLETGRGTSQGLAAHLKSASFVRINLRNWPTVIMAALDHQPIIGELQYKCSLNFFHFLFLQTKHPLRQFIIPCLEEPTLRQVR